MSQRIVIDPVTRLEGHGRVTIELNDAGEVQDAHFHVTQLRGFEKFVEGRPFHEMPSLMARICGICPVSHLIASGKACDQLLAVHTPPTGKALRHILNLAQMAQSHALSFFYLSAPDLLLGMDAPMKDRSIFGIYESDPQLARDGVRLRQVGQQIIEILAGKRIHPGWVVPGGVSEPLTAEKRDTILAMLPEAIHTTRRTIDWFKTTFSDFEEEIRSFANFPTMFMGMVGPNGEMAAYEGKLRFVDAEGRIVVDQVELRDYADYIAEAVEPYSYLKSPYYKPLGYPEGIYRVGPLARLNVVDSMGTPLADRELMHFHRLDRQSSFHYHYARLIEILYAFERIEMLLNEPTILDTHVRAQAAVNAHRGIGVAEAPRGTLIHDYEIDDNGLITRANLIIATGHNNLAMNKGVLQVAKTFVKGDRLTDGALNRVEAVIRTYDPCLSCSTHAVGQMPLVLQVVSPDGQIVDEKRR
jgi:NAD-reducing hydrogenase large subunit